MNIIQPTTYTFNEYLDGVRKVLIEKSMGSQQIGRLIELLRELERFRYDFTSIRAFQTKPFSIENLAHKFNVTTRTIQRWFSLIEKSNLGFREFRKNKHHQFKNLLSRFKFDDFKLWITKHQKSPNGAECHPNRKNSKEFNNYKFLNNKKNEVLTNFPMTGSMNYTKWGEIGLEIIRASNISANKRPSIDFIGGMFRNFLRMNNISPNNPSLLFKWKHYCKNARSV